MPDWNSSQEQANNRVVFVKLIHALAGVYLWEFATSLHFEWSFLSGKKRFTWPMIFYFLGRYSALLTIVNILVGLNVPSKVNCQALYTTIAVFTQLTIGFASINLALRAMVICSMSMYCVIPLSLTIAGHWAILMQSIQLTATWFPESGCLPTHLHSTNLAISFAYSVALDFIIVLLCAGQILRVNTSRSRLLSLMYRDGLTCFIVATLVNLPAAVLAALKFNPVMETLFTIPAAVLSTTVVCRAVRRLSNFSPNIPAVYMTSPEVEAVYPACKSCDNSNHVTATIRSYPVNPSPSPNCICIHTETHVVRDLMPGEEEKSTMSGFESSVESKIELRVDLEHGIEKGDGNQILAI